MTKNQGKVFEENFKNSYSKLPIYFLRLQDSAKWNRGPQSSFVPDSPFDSLQFKMPFLWTLELKSTDGTSISFYPNTPWEKPKDTKSNVMIKPNQIKQLQHASNYHGIIPGFILNYREKRMKTKTHPHETYFVHILDFIEFAISSGKSGISREDAKEIGVEFKSKMKKVNHTYDVEKFCIESPKFYLNKGYIDKDKLTHTRELIDDLLIIN